MGITRRNFLQGVAGGAATVKLTAQEAAAESKPKSSTERRRRTIYFNDARHYYLFVFEPPMALEDAWRPVDEVAGTAVDTFIYGVARTDGLFYPSKVGEPFKYGQHKHAFRQAAYWRLWHNQQSLIDRGLDPLRVLIDRAHEKGMDFFASLRLGAYLEMNPAHMVSRRLGSQGPVTERGRGFVHPEVRDHQFAVLRELATDYPTEGVELDFAAAPYGSPYCFRDEDAEAYTPLMTEWVRRVSEMVRTRPGDAGQIGARVYPTESINLARGLDVRTWLREGLLDYVVPLVYAYDLTDSQMPIDWLIETAHAAGTSVYAMIQTRYHTRHERGWATPAMMRAAAANHWTRGADGMYTWALQWPLGDAGRRILSELGDPELAKEGDKHYLVNKHLEVAEKVGYQTLLPLEIPASDRSRHRIPFTIADDIQAAPERIRRVRLKINITDLVSADQLRISLNGRSLAQETLPEGLQFENHSLLGPVVGISPAGRPSSKGSEPAGNRAGSKSRRSGESAEGSRCRNHC